MQERQLLESNTFSVNKCVEEKAIHCISVSLTILSNRVFVPAFCLFLGDFSLDAAVSEDVPDAAGGDATPAPTLERLIHEAPRKTVALNSVQVGSGGRGEQSFQIPGNECTAD